MTKVVCRKPEHDIAIRHNLASSIPQSKKRTEDHREEQVAILYAKLRPCRALFTHCFSKVSPLRAIVCGPVLVMIDTRIAG